MLSPVKELPPMTSLSRPTRVIEPGALGTIRTHYIDLNRPLPLDSGATLTSVRLAYEMYGRCRPRVTTRSSSATR
jgi:homoserine acetyltransferase